MATPSSSKNVVARLKSSQLSIFLAVLSASLWVAGGEGCSCNHTSSPTTKGYASLLITNYGDYSTEDGIWKIKVSKNDGSVSATYGGNFEKRFALGLGKMSGSVRSSISPAGWIANHGWCAFVENENRFWAYDGLTNLWMLEKTKDGTVVYGISTLPCPIPLSVVSRMSPEARSIGEKAMQK